MYRESGWSWKGESSVGNEGLIAPGDVILVSLPCHLPPGYEQEGMRPAVVLGIPPGSVRFSLVIAAPLTTASGSWSRENPVLYPSLPAGRAGLPRQSTVLLDQLRGLDAKRVAGYLGSLDQRDLERIRAGVRRLLQL